MRGTRPFLKWAGGKYRLRDHILDALPPARTLVEPFAGSAAIFLNSRYERYLLNDANRDLIGCYETLRGHGDAFIRAAESLFTADTNQAERYYALRAEFNECTDPFRRAVLFVYLNRHGYNGLCRYNSSGGFNVPFGRYRRPRFPRAELEAFRAKARRARFSCADFRSVMRRARAGDVVYCDPPYLPLSPTANFTAYDARGFSLEDQADLADEAARAAARGVTVLVSNHDTAHARELYAAASCRSVRVQRSISRDGQNRGAVDEVLALFSPAPGA